ncbi:MAG: hypothetical protein HYS98_04080 [Deltaproteobacteria bacterium]|nr:hypothetical protein [Deltaproteobacteria bacterium]
MKTLLLYLPFVMLSAAEPKLERLDPHGTETMPLKKISLAQHQECKVCHTQGDNQLMTRSNISERCISCHNKRPHSGIIEHEGLLVKTVTCINCHLPHRASLPPHTPKSIKEFSDSKIEAMREDPEFIRLKRTTHSLPEGLIRKQAPAAMLRNVCTDCHRW